METRQSDYRCFYEGCGREVGEGKSICQAHKEILLLETGEETGTSRMAALVGLAKETIKTMRLPYRHYPLSIEAVGKVFQIWFRQGPTQIPGGPFVCVATPKGLRLVSVKSWHLWREDEVLTAGYDAEKVAESVEEYLRRI